MNKRYGVIYVDRNEAGHGSNQRLKKDSFPGISTASLPTAQKYSFLCKRQLTFYETLNL